MYFWNFTVFWEISILTFKYLLTSNKHILVNTKITATFRTAWTSTTLLPSSFTFLPHITLDNLAFCKITANMVTSDNITLLYRFDKDIIVLSRFILTVSIISFSNN